MSLIEWTSALEIGHPEIDADHRRLVDLLNYFDAIPPTEGQRASEVLDALRAHTEAHFRREELLMDDIGFEHRTRHIKEHLHLTDELGELVASLKSGRSSACDLGRFVRDWLLEHIAQTDRVFAEALARAGALRRRRAPPKQAS